jgi:hypothetical protein
VKAYWIPAFLAPALLAGETLSTDYARERALRVEAETDLEVETTAFDVERDGVPAPSPPIDFAFGQARRIVTVDRVLARDGGLPTRVRRTYEEVEKRWRRFAHGREGKGVQDGDLTGATLEISREGDGDLRVEVVEGDEPETAAALDGQRLELALDALVLEDEVEPGETWLLGSEEIRRALGFDLAAALFPSPQDGVGTRRGYGSVKFGSSFEYLVAAEWEGRATLTAEREEHEGLACAMVQLELEGSGGGLDDPDYTRDVFEAQLAGRLLVSLEERRPVLLELEGSVRIQSTVEGEDTKKTHLTQEGTLSHRAEVGVE